MSGNIIIIAGGIGAGKSVVSRICRTLGYYVYDCDYNAKRLMNQSEDFLNKLAAQFGKGMLDENMRINTTNVANLIFNNKEARVWVNKTVHEMVRNDIMKLACESGKHPIFVESAIAASSGLLDMAAGCWLVTAEESIRIARVMQRNGSDEQSVIQRIEAQRKEDALIRNNSIRSDVIENDSDTPLLPRIKELLEKYKNYQN